MSYPSQIIMVDLPSSIASTTILNAFQKLGHHPVNAVINKKRKSDEKENCIVQFANEEAAKQAVIKLNGKQIPNYSNGAKFKLSQCIGNRATEYPVWVGDLTADVDDYHFFKFFADRYQTLCNAKVITDNRDISKGYGFLRFTSEEEQKHCLQNTNGSLGLGCRPIRVGPVTKPHQISTGSLIVGNPIDSNENVTKPSEFDAVDESWQTYKNWNKTGVKNKITFAAVRSKISTKEQSEANQQLRLVEYNVPLKANDLNEETLERDCYLWDALECTKWLPEMALSVTTTTT